jgi:hypothetical protein
MTRQSKQTVRFVTDDLASFAELLKMIERDGLLQRDRTHGRLPCLAEFLTGGTCLPNAFTPAKSCWQNDDYGERACSVG